MLSFNYFSTPKYSIVSNAVYVSYTVLLMILVEPQLVELEMKAVPYGQSLGEGLDTFLQKQACRRIVELIKAEVVNCIA